MPESFDPYLSWLGIRDPQRPPDHYRLLGVAMFESDPDVLTHAADRQMAHVRTFQMGKHSAESQRLLNELAAAKVCLLNPAKKAEYDAWLAMAAAEQGIASPPGGAHPPPVPPQPPVLSPPVSATSGFGPEPVVPLPWEPPEAPELPGLPAPVAAKRSSWALPAAIATLAVTALVLVALIVMFSINGGPQGPLATNVPPSKEDDDASAVWTDPQAKDEPTPKPKVEPKDKPEPKVEPKAKPEPEVEPQPKPKPQQGEDDAPEPEAKTDANPPAEKRLPVPSPEALQKAVDVIHESFRNDYSRATTANQRRALAAKLLQVARGTTDDPDARYALLSEACDQALEGGAAPVFQEALAAMSSLYLVDLMGTARDALQSAAKRARDAGALRAMVTTAMDLSRKAVAKEEFDAAKQLADLAWEIAKEVTRKTKDSTQQKEATKLKNDVAVWQQRYATFRQAEQVLAEDPEDPAANLTSGMYHCFVRNDWESGLPLLEKSKDAKLRKLAEAELAQPVEQPTKKVELGDGWWEAGDPDDVYPRQHFQSRAVFWYKAALPDLTGFTRTRVEGRLKEAGIK